MIIVEDKDKELACLSNSGKTEKQGGEWRKREDSHLFSIMLGFLAANLDPQFILRIANVLFLNWHNTVISG